MTVCDTPETSVPSVGRVPPEVALTTLTRAVQELSLAPTAERVQQIVRSAARRLTGSDGATFVLRDEGRCFYVDEDAIEPLWKGQRFPLEACISGWAMLNRQHVVIEDIYADQRIPHDAYRPTFVKSLVMVPIRTLEPIGAIGLYWADRHLATDEEVGLARALADSTAVALESVQRGDRLGRAERMAGTDPLTGVANRRSWDRVLHDAVVPGRSSISILALDLDHFKRYNDEHGHQAGDSLLVEVAARWSSALRGGDVLGNLESEQFATVLRERDILARLGGEEFGAVLRDCSPAAAVRIAERLQHVLPDDVTVSVGAVSWDGFETVTELTARADAALYAAKAAGRNRIVAY